MLDTTARETDSYGRKLRLVVRDGTSLGDVLVKEGLARAWDGRRHPWCN
jgi:endonuclease YncB( thermonuclease family)